jgi:hypothetical protein
LEIGLLQSWEQREISAQSLMGQMQENEAQSCELLELCQQVQSLAIGFSFLFIFFFSRLCK